MTLLTTGPPGCLLSAGLKPRGATTTGDVTMTDDINEVEDTKLFVINKLIEVAVNEGTGSFFLNEPSRKMWADFEDAMSKKDNSDEELSRCGSIFDSIFEKAEGIGVRNSEGEIVLFDKSHLSFISDRQKRSIINAGLLRQPFIAKN